jgi:DNA mismatch endonuclease (patch repair protein)
VTRSELMRRIKSKGNASTELAMAAMLRRHGVTGWRRQTKVLGFRPDFVLRKARIAVFVDGCFWHGCPEHCRIRESLPYWRDKIGANRFRDAKQNIRLADGGWEVARVWEHELKGEPSDELLSKLAYFRRRA